MTTNYTGTNGGSLPNSITGPEAGENVTGASVGLVAQGAANQDKFLFDAMTRVAYTDDVRGFNGRTTRPGAVGHVAVADGDRTIGVRTGTGVDYAGKRFRLTGNPGAPRVITIDDSHTSPKDGETVEVFWFSTLFPNSEAFRFERESGTEIAHIWSSGAAKVTAMNCWIEFEYVAGTGWMLGRNSGSFVDTTPELCGVIPGAGA